MSRTTKNPHIAPSIAAESGGTFPFLRFRKFDGNDWHHWTILP